jgi:hypothetical protein
MSYQTRTEEMQQCIDNAADCHAICMETLQYCLSKGGQHNEAEHITLLTDCAEMSRSVEDFLLRESRLYREVCDVCATICEKCAQECERFTDDEQMELCTETCRTCAQFCRDMLEIRT